MAKKKASEPMPAAMTEPKLKYVRLDLTPEEHKALRMAAAAADMSMTSLAKKIVVQAVMTSTRPGARS
jgi:predicted HicB family RNase H-like nuclease